jgi:hypothetical protein
VKRILVISVSLAVVLLVFTSRSDAGFLRNMCRFGLRRYQPNSMYQPPMEQNTEPPSDKKDPLPIEPGSPKVSAEEQKWYDDMFQKKYIDSDFASVWQGMTSAQRREFYDKIKKTEKDAEDKAKKEQDERDRKDKDKGDKG